MPASSAARTYEQPRRGADTGTLTRDLCAEPVQCVHLAHEGALADASHGRVAGQLANGLEFLREQKRAGARTRSTRCCLAPCMAAAYNADYTTCELVSIPPNMSRW